MGLFDEKTEVENLVTLSLSAKVDQFLRKKAGAALQLQSMAGDALNFFETKPKLHS
jgi:hypothetical protein